MATDDYPQRAFAHVGESRNPFNEQFAKLVEENLDSFHVPSVTIAIVDGDKTYSAGYGIAELPSTKATPSTLYMAGSTTKSFTALSLLQLIDARTVIGANKEPLTIKTPVSSLLPEFALDHAYLSNAATLEDILSHRTGLPRHDEAYFKDNNTIEDLLARLPHLDLTAEPRTKWQYNNLMFEVASTVIERLSGQPLRDYMKEKIWSKLGMDSTFLRLQDAKDFVTESNSAEPKIPAHLARGYFWDEEKKEFLPERWMDTPTVTGAGHVISNVLDYAEYLRAMIDGAEGVVSETSKTELRTARSLMPPEEDPAQVGTSTYTLAWSKITYPPGIDVYNHTGGLGGFGAYMAYVPALKWGFASLSNTALSSNSLEIAVSQYLLDEKLGVPAEKRLDHFALAQEQLKKITDSMNEKADTVFPHIPEKRVSKNLAIEAYAGEYRSLGYGPLTLKLVDDDGGRDLKNFGNYAGTDSSSTETKTLRLEHLTKSPWNFYADFEHASGEFFLLKFRAPDDDPHLIRKYRKAEFRVSVDGVPSEVGIQWDSANPVVWYQRVKEKDAETGTKP